MKSLPINNSLPTFVLQVKEGSRMEETLDFYSDDLGGSFNTNNVNIQTQPIFVKL